MNFLVKQEKFEGPLDLLLHLIEQEELAISEVSLAKVADEYLATVRQAEGVKPDALAEFLVVVASLMLIKSRSLLPSLQTSEEDERSLEELEHRLEEYRKIRDQAETLADLMRSGRQRIFSRDLFAGVLPAFLPPSSVSAQHLREAFGAFLASLPQPKKLTQATIRAIITLEEKIAAISALVEAAIEKTFAQITSGAGDRTEIIVSFLALLELARQQKIVLVQDERFGDIVIRKV